MPWLSKGYPCFYTLGKFEANAAFTTFAINAKIYGKFDPTSLGKTEQNQANVAFADGLLQICYRGKSVFFVQ